MSTRFFTNNGDNTLLAKFRGIFEHNPDIERFDALIGYLRASGYFAIRPHLENVPKIRILVGINVDAIVDEYQKRGHLFLADSGKTLQQFRENLAADIRDSRYTPEVEQGILRFAEDVATKKVEIRAHPTRRLHAKIYLFIPKGFNEHKTGAVITGSSNLTAAGLGVEDRGANYEFNVLLHAYDDVKFASDEFNFLWEEGVPVLPAEITAITANSHLREDLTPFELYLKLLIEYFGPAIDYDPNSETDMPEGFMRLAYQMDAVKQGFLMLQKHNGFFLADVVGLGKTIVGTLIAKKFFYHNGFPNHLSEILVVAPPTMLQAWRDAFDRFGIKTAKFVSCGSLHKVKSANRFDLVIVDEAHRFRNDTSDAFDLLQRICKTPTKRRLADGSFARKKIVLVSATPLNNRPDDIKNLVALFQDLKDSTLEIHNLQRFFARKQKEFEKAMRELTHEEARQAIHAIYEEIRVKIVQEVTIRRTRTDLLEHEDYASDLEAQGIRFPKVGRPRKILYPLPPPIEVLYDRTVEVLAARLTYNRYRAIAFLVPEKKLRYQQADRISAQLAKIMKIMLLKRLDSSFTAFRGSLRRFRDATDAMVRMFEKGTIYIAPNLGVSEYILEGREEELIQLIEEAQQTDPSISICTPDDFEKGFLPGLRSDFELLDSLVKQWQAVAEDPKLDAFLGHLHDDLLSREMNHPASLGKSPRLVIFSESKETTHYLAESLRQRGITRLLTVDSATRKDLMPLIRLNFDANVRLEEQQDDFDILISTEVLAEGVNLHRANVILNYDTPWNSTRLMQRIGRVNRIGTTADTVHVFNFFPTAKVDADIELKKKAVAKLQAFHTALGEDSQIYSTEEEVDNFGLFDTDMQEEKDEALALLMELRKFRQENPARFREIRNLPLRARCGRRDKTRAESTVTFIRNRRRDAFYHLPAGGEPLELSFVEAARIFQANAKEKSCPLHDQHHNQVGAALDRFRSDLQAEAARGDVVDHQIGPNEQKALRFLSLFLSLPMTSDDERQRIKAAQDAIRRARFAKLHRELNKLEKAQKSTPVQPAILLEKALQILGGFPLMTADEGRIEENRAGLSAADLQPAIILSESFTD
ncbi:MAG: helicase [Verrucomicrobia bacterium]|nr:helicase [Verrucomicrobiota bacterium]